MRGENNVLIIWSEYLSRSCLFWFGQLGADSHPVSQRMFLFSVIQSIISVFTIRHRVKTWSSPIQSASSQFFFP